MKHFEFTRMSAPRSADRWRRRAAAHPRVVLAWCVVLALVAMGMYAIAPWVLPARIVDGPMVQMATGESVRLVWYTSRVADCRVEVTVGGTTRTVESTPGSLRHSIEIAGLEPSTEYPYQIFTGRRELTLPLEFATNRLPDERYSFIVFGDSGRGTRVQYQLSNEMFSIKPPADFLLHTGDIVYPDGERRRYNEHFFIPYRRLLARVNFWPCLGNHDVTREGAALAYDEVFDLPDNGPAGGHPGFNYWFDFASSRIAVIDSNLETTSDAWLADSVAPWLVETMRDERPVWRFASLHHPPYTVGKYRVDERLQRTLVPAFEEADIDIVFNGHDHNYQRFHPMRGGVRADDGVVYVVTGAGGARLYDPRENAGAPDTLAAAEFSKHSFTQVIIEGEKLTLRQIDASGRLIDEYSLTKRAAATQAAGTQPATQSAP